MKRKVAIARSLINNPEVLIYDEPASGLDPMTSKYITDFISSLKYTGKTIIFSAHNLYQVETMCDRILIMKNGRVVRQGSVEDLLSNAYYVSGHSTRVDAFIQDRTVIGSQTVNDLKTAVVEGDLNAEKRSPGLTFSAVTIQKLFIHLTDDKSEQER